MLGIRPYKIDKKHIIQRVLFCPWLNLFHVGASFSLAQSFPRRCFVRRPNGSFVILVSIRSPSVRRAASWWSLRCLVLYSFPLGCLLRFLRGASLAVAHAVPRSLVARLPGGGLVGRCSIRSPEIVFLACGWVLPCPWLTPCHLGSFLGVLTGFSPFAHSLPRRFFSRRADRVFVLFSLLATEVLCSAC